MTTRRKQNPAIPPDIEAVLDSMPLRYRKKPVTHLRERKQPTRTSALVLEPWEADYTIWVSKDLFAAEAETETADTDDAVAGEDASNSYTRKDIKLRKTTIRVLLTQRRRAQLASLPKKLRPTEKQAKSTLTRSLRLLGRQPVVLTNQETHLLIYVDYPRFSKLLGLSLYPVELRTHLERMRRVRKLQRDIAA